ncbi:MAG: hypothetical protein K8F91_22060 [Candidatus Obscuribacterales bacterium]|nr:hypothetical protein [Candidatus Obscuribacterales bacterium]
MKSNANTSVQVDFEQGRGFGRMGLGLPQDFLDSNNPLVVASTIAALYTNPEDEDGARRTNKYSRAMVSLALYAGGCPVSLTKQQYRKLERRVRDYASIMDCHEYEGSNNLSFARYVLRNAKRRAKNESVI